MAHRKELQKTGGGTVEPLDLLEWEVGCLSLMDGTALEGVGVADYGSADPDAPGTSRSVAPEPAPAVRKRKAVEPLPPLPSPTPPPPPTSARTVVEVHPPPQENCIVQQAAQSADILDIDVGSPSFAGSPACSPPHLQSTIVEAEGEEIVTLEFIPASPLLEPHEPEESGDNNVLSSSREYSIPDSGHLVHSNEAVDAGVVILQQILQRLTALENQERVAPPPPPPSDSVLPDAVRGIRRLLVSQERRRRAENQQIVAAICNLTEQQRLSGIAIATAISQQTTALRQILTSNAMQGPIAGTASASTSPPHSPGTASTSTQESPRPRGLRRQRGGKRGGK